MQRLASVFVVLAILTVWGCGPRSAKGSVTGLVGPGGSVEIGDSLEQAKKAFPAPAGAHVMDRAMNFAIVTDTGWAWADEKENSGFEAATKGGKIIALARTGGDAGQPEKTIAEIGEPSRKAVGTTAEVYVWDTGKLARFWIHFKEQQPLFPIGSITMVGSQEDLKLLNYRAEDPKNIVDQMDAASKQMNSPEFRKAFEQAKERAKAKQGKP